LVHKYQETTTNNHQPMRIVEDGIFGVVLGGEAPVRSMVSRGVESLTAPEGVPQPTSPYVVQDVNLVRPGDDDYIFSGGGSNDMPSVHMIQSVRNIETGKVMSAVECMMEHQLGFEFLGVKRPNEDGFELHMMNPHSQAIGSFLVMVDGNAESETSLQGAHLDFFNLTGEACMQDMDSTVEKLREQTQGEQILGSIMFSCSGRGPHPSLIPEEMADAKRFQAGFPDVPCLGFYAGGEIGPIALAGKEKVFQVGKASVQGFTAVFCLFIVPVVEPTRYQIDDCRENVSKFITSRLM
jgi:hypothetical protein